MSTLLKMQKFHPLCSRCIGMYPLQNRWTVLRYLQCYENFSECCTHLILPETALFSPTPTFAKEPEKCISAYRNLESHFTKGVANCPDRFGAGASGTDETGTDAVVRSADHGGLDREQRRLFPADSPGRGHS